ncbi:hypothetical protein B0J14DRAFT_668082 [Halenospora varia]|nr:hypothetical protein B0J14DRAFT_668082 [Halenospora varia]
MSSPSQDDLPPSSRTRSSQSRASAAIPPPTPTRRSVRLTGGPDSLAMDAPSTPRKNPLMDGNLIQPPSFHIAGGARNAPSTPLFSHHAHPSPPPLAATPTMPSPYPGGYNEMPSYLSSQTPVRASRYAPLPRGPATTITNMPSIGAVLSGHRPNPFSSSPASPSGPSIMSPPHYMGASPVGRAHDLESSPTITPGSYALHQAHPSGQFPAGAGRRSGQLPLAPSPAPPGQQQNPFVSVPAAQQQNPMPAFRPANPGRLVATNSPARHHPLNDMRTAASPLADPRLATALGIQPSHGPFSHSIRTTTAPYFPLDPNWPDLTVGASFERHISARQAKNNWDAMGGAEGMRDALRAQEEHDGDADMEGYDTEDPIIKNIRAAATSGPPPLRPGYDKAKKQFAPSTSTSRRANPLVNAGERAQQPGNISLASVEAARRNWVAMSATIKEEKIEGGNNDQMDIDEGSGKRRKIEVEAVNKDDSTNSQESEDISPKVVEQAVQDMQGITGQIAAAFDNPIAPAIPAFLAFPDVAAIPPHILGRLADAVATHGLEPRPTIDPKELHLEGPVAPANLAAATKFAHYLPTPALSLAPLSTASPSPVPIPQNTHASSSSSAKHQKPCSDCTNLNFSRLANHEQGNLIRCKECKRDLLLPSPANKHPCPVSQKKEFQEWKNGSYYDEKADKLFMEQMIGLGFVERVSVEGKEIGVKRDNLEKWKVSKKIIWDGDDYVGEAEVDEDGNVLEEVDLEMDIEEEFRRAGIPL